MLIRPSENCILKICKLGHVTKVFTIFCLDLCKVVPYCIVCMKVRHGYSKMCSPCQTCWLHPQRFKTKAQISCNIWIKNEHKIIDKQSFPLPSFNPKHSAASPDHGIKKINLLGAECNIQRAIPCEWQIGVDVCILIPQDDCGRRHKLFADGKMFLFSPACLSFYYFT